MKILIDMSVRQDTNFGAENLRSITRDNMGKIA